MNIVFGRFIIMLCLLGGLYSCSLTSNDMKSNHKETREKWDLLVEYTTNKSILKLNSILLAGSIRESFDDQSGVSYVITNLKLTKSLKETEINFLQPNILRAFACSLNENSCIHFQQLLEHNTTSVLTDVFKEQEAELFYLYSNILLVEEEIQKLNLIAPNLLRSYFIYLAREEQSFESIGEFVKYLYRSFTQERLTNFSKHKGSLMRGAVDEQEDSTDVYTLYSELPAETAIWGDVTPETNSWNNDSYQDSSFIVASTSEDELLMELLRDTQDIQSSDEYTKIRTFNERKNLPISLNSQVCSYSDNYFGKVSEFLLDDEVIVSTIGVAKEIVDGIVRPLEPGHLFSNATDIYIKPIRINKTYTLSDLSVCLIE